MSEDVLGGLKPIVGQGHPLDPDRHKVLSADDEKRMDEKGNPITEGKLWSDCGTGMYLVIGLSTGVMSSDKVMVGRTEISLGSEFAAPGFKLHVMASPYGKPTFTIPMVGACLELPDDLGRDKLKRQYVTEWIIHTVMEALLDRKINLTSMSKAVVEDFLLAVSMAAETAIVATRL